MCCRRSSLLILRLYKAARHWRRSYQGLRRMPPSKRWLRSPKGLLLDAKRPGLSEGLVLASSSQINLGLDVHPRTKLMVAVFALFQHDLDRDALNDFYVVASRVFRREQAEDRAGGTGNAVNVTFVSSVVGIARDLDFVRWPHVLQLRFFEDRGDPHLIERDDCEQLFAGIDV